MQPIWKVPWYRPIGVNEPLDTIAYYDVLLFQLESPILLNWDYFDRHDQPDPQKFPYRYKCMSCYAASGSNDVFSTQSEQKQSLKDGPTQEQQDQMSDHARQHTIMWAWARSLEGK